MYPYPATFRSIAPDSLWWVYRSAEENDVPYVAMSTGPNVLAACRRMLSKDVFDTDITFDGLPCGPMTNPSVPIVDAALARRLWVVFRRMQDEGNSSITSNTLVSAMLPTAARVQVTPTLATGILKATYHSRRKGLGAVLQPGNILLSTTEAGLPPWDVPVGPAAPLLIPPPRVVPLTSPVLGATTDVMLRRWISEERARQARVVSAPPTPPVAPPAPTPSTPSTPTPPVPAEPAIPATSTPAVLAGSLASSPRISTTFVVLGIGSIVALVLAGIVLWMDERREKELRT